MKRTICLLLASLLCLAPAAADGLRLSTVVIDAGHGGKDSGAVSKDGKSYEKTFVLDIAKTLRDKIRAAYPDLNVILTRSTDTYVTLGGRADIANKANANLFISIHINSIDKTSPNGYSVHVLGQSHKKGTDLYANNMDIVRRENSVILLEDDYSTTYGDFDPNDPESYIFMNLMQNANLEQSVRFAELVEKHLKGGPIKNDRGVSQDPFLVLWRTAMPAVLLELGFISNATDLAALRQQTDRDKLAERVFQAFKEYKTIYEGGASQAAAVQQKDPAPSVPKTETAPAKSAPEGDTMYAVQIFAVRKSMDPKSPEFMGYTPRVIKSGTLNKYFIATGRSAAEVRKKLPAIRKKYPDAFVVKIVGETVTRVD